MALSNQSFSSNETKVSSSNETKVSSSNKKKLLSVFLFLIILISIPLGMYLVKQTQTGRSRASEGEGRCIPSGDDRSIQAVLNGDGAEAVLCQGAVFNLNKPIIFTAPNQKIYTEGFPTDERRALLKIVDPNLTNAIDARGAWGSPFKQGYLAYVPTDHIEIRNIRIDGNRGGLGRRWRDENPYTAQQLSEGYDYWATVEMGGNATGQLIENTEIKDPRSWSALFIHPGGVVTDNGNKRYTCSGVTIRGNTIGPTGWPEGAWADGISLACNSSIVENNLIVDATDVGIAIFGSPGSIIRNNIIRNINLTLLGGISMVGYGFNGGDFSNTLVENNIIDAQGSLIKIGVAMGSKAWDCPDVVEQERAQYGAGQNNRGGIVRNNTLSGQYMGYGFLINGVENYVIENNRSNAVHIGTPNPGCGSETPSPPVSFIKDPNNIRGGTIQADFINGNVNMVLRLSNDRASWLPPYCKKDTFQGCGLLKWPASDTCQDWGNQSYPHWNNATWSSCQSACSRPDPNQYCREQNQASTPTPTFISTPTPSSNPINRRPVGYFDGVDNASCKVSGWAKDEDDLNARVKIHVYKDVNADGGGGEWVGEYMADKPQGQGESLGGNYRFEATLPLQDNRDHKLSVYALDSAPGVNNNTRLIGSPKDIHCPVSASVIQSIIQLFGSSGDSSQGDQNGDGVINELDFGGAYSR